MPNPYGGIVWGFPPKNKGHPKDDQTTETDWQMKELLNWYYKSNMESASAQETPLKKHISYYL